MALSRLENLYRAVILDHSSSPRNFGELSDANGRLELHNPTCWGCHSFTCTNNG